MTNLIASGVTRRLGKLARRVPERDELSGDLFDAYSVGAIIRLHRRVAPDVIKSVAFSDKNKNMRKSYIVNHFQNTYLDRRATRENFSARRFDLFRG